ncbi:NAD(P)-binding protein [Chaetomidium leptoderma]|uniref:NAD(P)-binding protein n=1 Tax=Chaetomidium leptoderma TaxID=669021 RepID=A0AAN6ZX17_9PEZI|nr:NAD(P)-binding protein [Chaetomidium leptoderma]
MPTQPGVTRQHVQASNARIDGESYPRTAVFVGGTAGTGELALQELALTGKGKWAARIYVVGRSESASRVNKSLDRLQAQNPDVELIWTPGEASLLADVKRICTEVKAKEKSLDLLFLSAGYAPLGGREETSEGLNVSQSLSHYSRILFIQHLLPLLKASTTQGRVVSILGGGLETTRIDLDNLNFEKPGSFSGMKCQTHNLVMQSMAMEQLAEDNKDVTFIHAYPGLVKTGNLNRGWRDRWFLQLLANIVLAPLFWIMAFSLEESKQRMFYLATSAKYGGHGVPLQEPVAPGLTSRGEETGSVFLVNHLCATVTNEKVMAELRKEAKGRIWAKTTEVTQPYI